MRIDRANMSEIEMLQCEHHDVRSGIVPFVGMDMGLGAYTCEPHEDDELVRIPDGWYEAIGRVQEIEETYGPDRVWSLNDDDPKNYVIVEYTSHGDYGGGLVEKANCQVLMELCSEYDTDEDMPYLGEEWYSENMGSYGTRWFELKCWPFLPREVYEAICSLADYPLLDDSLYSELELSSRDECWESFGRADLIRDCQRALDDEDEALDAWLDDESAEQAIDAVYRDLTVDGWGYAEGLTWVFPEVDIEEFIDGLREAMAEGIKA